MNTPVPFPQLPPAWPAELTERLRIREVREFVLFAAHSLQVPPDIVLLNVLGAANTAVNGKFEVVRDTGHREPVQVYFCLIASPGERKSAAAKVAKAPILAFVKAARKRGMQIRLYFEDATPTALKRALAENGGRLSCHSAEPDLLNILGRRSFPKPLICGAYDGEEIIVDRANEDPVVVPDAALCICVSAQPEVALAFARTPEVKESGLRGRFLFSEFPEIAGTRSVDVPPIPEEAAERYGQIIRRLLEIPAPVGGGRYRMSLTSQAEGRFLEFARQAEHELLAGGVLSFDTGWGSKLPGKVLRLAALLHCLAVESPIEQSIGEDAILQAIAMGNIFTLRARTFLLRADFGKVEDSAQEILAWAWKTQRPAFMAHDVHMALPHLSTKEIHAAIMHLQQTGRVVEDLSAFAQGISTSRRGRHLAPRYLIPAFMAAPVSLPPTPGGAY